MSNSNHPAAEARTTVTVVFTNDQIARLDEVSAEIRRRTGKAVTRSALIRAVVIATRGCHAEWLKCRSEAEVCRAVVAQLIRGSK